MYHIVEYFLTMFATLANYMGILCVQTLHVQSWTSAREMAHVHSHLSLYVNILVYI